MFAGAQGFGALARECSFSFRRSGGHLRAYEALTVFAGDWAA